LTIRKGLVPNAGNAVGYGYSGNADAEEKSPFSNAGNAVWYGYAGKAGAIRKGKVPNAGNRKVLYARRDTDFLS
jgi:hypothetical protein